MFSKGRISVILAECNFIPNFACNSFSETIGYKFWTTWASFKGRGLNLGGRRALPWRRTHPACEQAPTYSLVKVSLNCRRKLHSGCQIASMTLQGSNRFGKWTDSYKAKHIHALWFRHACFNCLSQKYKNICTQRDLDKSLLNSLIHNSPRLEASQVSILRWVDDRLGYRAWWNTAQQYQGASWSLCKNRLSKGRQPK